MTDYVNTWLATTPGPVRPAIVTKRGDRLSVQASAGHYCSPRNGAGPWSLVEVWWPNRCPRTLRQYQSKGDSGPITFCPVSAVNEWIGKRGGLA